MRESVCHSPRGRCSGALALAGAALATLVLASCGGTQKPKRSAQLRVIAEPATAVVYVDEFFIAPARKLEKTPVPLRPGVRRLTVKAPGHFPHDMEVDLTPGVTTVEIALRPQPL